MGMLEAAQGDDKALPKSYVSTHFLVLLLFCRQPLPLSHAYGELSANAQTMWVALCRHMLGTAVHHLVRPIKAYGCQPSGAWKMGLA